MIHLKSPWGLHGSSEWACLAGQLSADLLSLRLRIDANSAAPADTTALTRSQLYASRAALTPCRLLPPSAQPPNSALRHLNIELATYLSQSEKQTLQVDMNQQPLVLTRTAFSNNARNAGTMDPLSLLGLPQELRMIVFGYV